MKECDLMKLLKWVTPSPVLPRHWQSEVWICAYRGWQDNRWITTVSIGNTAAEIVVVNGWASRMKITQRQSSLTFYIFVRYWQKEISKIDQQAPSYFSYLQG